MWSGTNCRLKFKQLNRLLNNQQHWTCRVRRLNKQWVTKCNYHSKILFLKKNSNSKNSLLYNCTLLKILWWVEQTSGATVASTIRFWNLVLTYGTVVQLELQILERDLTICWLHLPKHQNLVKFLNKLEWYDKSIKTS